MNRRLAKKLLIIGWDGADWQIIKPLLEQGRMPALASLIQRGVMGNLASMEPMVSPMLWTTIATGKHPFDHGVCGFIEPDPETTMGVRTVSSSSRRCGAFWNILSEQGFRTNLIGWYASHPAERIHGVNVSEKFAKPTGLSRDPWPVPPGSVVPATLVPELESLRIHPTDISLEQVEYLIPAARQIDQRRERLIQRLAVDLAECATHQALASWVLETQPWDVTAVYFNTLDHICHKFMYFHPPRMAFVGEDLFDRYQHVVNRAYQFHDMMLARLLKLAGDDATVMILSDHGYQTGDRRPVWTSKEGTGPIAWHRRHGVFVLKGPGVREDELVFGARLLDIAPTILALMGVPAAEDMPGRVLEQAFSVPFSTARVASWDIDRVFEPAATAVDDSLAERAALQQLIDLGYVEADDAGGEDVRLRAEMERQFNLGRAYMHARRFQEAATHLETVHRQQPTRLNVALQLADCYQRSGRDADCRTLIDFISAGNCFEDSAQDNSLRQLPQVDLLRGIVEMNAGNLESALAHFRQVEETAGALPGLRNRLGEVYLRLNRYDDAGRVFSAALELEPDDTHALNGMAAVHLNGGRDELAMSCALHSLEVLYHQPKAHFLLAMALKRQGDLARARDALEVALRMNPADQETERQLGSVTEMLAQAGR